MFATSSLASNPDSAASVDVPRTFIVADRDHSQRAAIEAFITEVYRARFAARVGSFAPTLVALSIDGELAAAAGYRRASEALYLERYLGEPIEAAIRARTGVRVRRDSVVEVGHYASMRHGEGRRLMTPLARHLHLAGARWAATTATGPLRRLYGRLGLRACWLAEATRDTAGPDGAEWGTYYDHAPAVVAGPIARSLAQLERRIG